MRKTRIWMTIGCGLCAVAATAWAQPHQKAGLWETTVNMTWQKSPFPPGMQMPPQAAAAFGGGPRTVQVCLTQAWIDKYGGAIPQNRGDCQMTDVKYTGAGMTANMVCTGRMTGSGTVEADWSIPDTGKGKVHFTGAMQMGPNPTPIEWTNEFTSVYKGPDCGSVKPIVMPADK